MADSDGREPIERLAEEFVERLRRGERPSAAEYAERYPELAGQIHAVFPTLLLVEQLGPRPAEPWAPDRLGEYRLVREVGRGGMGVVYEAIQESLGRAVALKVLLPQRCGERYLERFHREAKAAAR